MKISLLGVSRSGKTCYISAMSQIVKSCKLTNGQILSIKENNTSRQLELDNNFMTMVTEKRWPKNTDITTSYNFRMQYNDNAMQLNIDSLEIDDYRGGVLTAIGNTADKERQNFLRSMGNTAVILFLIDGTTILNAMDNLDKAIEHRDIATPAEILAARNEISIMENILYNYVNERKDNKELPPIMLVVTKSDVFASEEEYQNGVNKVKELLPSLFLPGSNTFVAITKVSLGTNLEKDINGGIIGSLDISTRNNIHIPMLFAVYAFLDATYEQYEKSNKNNIDQMMCSLRSEFSDKVKFYSNGREAFAV